MALNFIACDREQELLLPPSLREWLPEDHSAWFVIDAVVEMDMAAFYGAYRVDGWGRAANDPAMMVASLLYVYAIGERSSRRIGGVGSTPGVSSTRAVSLLVGRGHPGKDGCSGPLASSPACAV